MAQETEQSQFVSLAAAELVNLSAGLLVDELDDRIQAGKSLERGGSDGLVRTIGYVPDKDRTDAVGPYSSADRLQSLAIRQTYAAQRPMAYKGRGHKQPKKLHTLVEQDNRYFGASGTPGLDLSNLSRLSLAVSATAAQRVRARMRTVVVSEGKKPLEIDQTMPDPLYVVDQHDKFVASRTSFRGQKASNGASILAQGLRSFTDTADTKHGLKSRSDTCLIVSDMIMGAKRDPDGNLLGFDWEEPLRSLEERLGDRLFIIRLTTPAHTTMPDAPSFDVNGTKVRLDTGERMAGEERYQKLGIEKVGRIANILGRFRHLELNSTTTTPFTDVANFVFGKPPEYR